MQNDKPDSGEQYRRALLQNVLQQQRAEELTKQVSPQPGNEGTEQAPRVEFLGVSPYNQQVMITGMREEWARIQAQYRNEGLEWAASWIESQATGAEPSVAAFAANVAMSIRAAKEQGRVE